MKTSPRQIWICKNREHLSRAQGDRRATKEWQLTVHRDNRGKKPGMICSVPNEISRGAFSMQLNYHSELFKEERYTFGSLHELAFQYYNETPEVDNPKEMVIWTQF